LFTSRFPFEVFDCSGSSDNELFSLLLLDADAREFTKPLFIAKYEVALAILL
jgi:hypothetical protein